MKDLAIELENRPGALAEMGEALGRAGVSIEGGGAWVVDGRGVAHFLFEDGTAARRALEAAGIKVLAEREVLVQRLKQAVPGQLGALTRRVVDDLDKGRAVSDAWARELQADLERQAHSDLISRDEGSDARSLCLEHTLPSFRRSGDGEQCADRSDRNSSNDPSSQGRRDFLRA